MDPRRTLIFIVVGILATYAWWRYDHRDGRRAAEKFTPAEAPKLNLEDVKVLANLDAEYAKLVQAVVPSVVSITSSGLVRVPLTLEDVILRRQRAREATSLGSGVIVSKEGHVLTNHHVIAGMSEIRVQLSDGRNVPARLIGSDSGSDVAVLRIDESNIEPLPLGDSDGLRVGQQVFAVGNPYGFEETVTRGIVSAKGGRMRTDRGVEFIQHDAAVNQGNSGGPLLNIRGEVVGINSRIFSTTGGFDGISLAIPSNTARKVLDGIVARGRVLRPYLGVSMEDVTLTVAREFRLSEAGGILIREVEPDSPAARAGLQPGDVVKTFDGKRIGNTSDLGKAIAGTEIGKEVEIVILRGGVARRTSAVIAEAPAK
jgi:serine protease Do